jgi:hypothetical protein
MSALIRFAVALASTVWIAGCASGPSTTPSAFVTSPRAKVIPTERVKAAVSIGKSTKADVIASLGETLVISFDTGYEVWVYRLAEDRRGEYVVLFDPSGLLTKTRIRTGSYK